MTITVTPTVEASATPPRVRLDITGTTETSTTPLRLDPNGTLVPVRTFDGNPLALSGTPPTGLLYDNEVPYSQIVQYTSIETPGTYTANVTVPVTVPWLTHPGVPALSMPVNFRPGTLNKETRAVRKGVFWPMGRKTPITVSDGVRRAPQSSLIVSLESLLDISNFDALLDDAAVLLLNLPPNLGIGLDTCYIDIQDVDKIRFTDNVIDGYRDAVLPFYVVDRPAGGSQAGRTLADLLEYPSLAAVDAAYSSLAAVLAGP